MNDEQLLRTLGSWLTDADEAPRDPRRLASRASMEVSRTRQRGRWLPFPLSRRKAQTPTAIDTADHRPSPIPATNGRAPIVIGRTQTMLSPVKVIVAGALVVALGSLFLVAQPFSEPGGSVPGAQSTQAESPAPTLDGQTIAEMVNDAVNGCDVANCDAAPFEAVYAPDVRLIVGGEVYAEGVDGMMDASRTADRAGNTFRLVTPVAEFRASDGDLYVAQWVDVIGREPILSLMQIRDGKVIRQVDGGPPVEFATAQ